MDKNKQWESFNKKKSNYPKWPNETMLKVFFGSYLENKIEFRQDMNVLDVGCGFGNNLIPFLDIGLNCYGTEVTAEMASQTQEILKKQNLDTTIKEGFNTSLPFDDNMFDILIAVNVIHYENSQEDIEKALNEYSRVLKKDGILFISTAGIEHDIVKKSKLVGDHVYEVQNYDFRNGNRMFFFDTEKFLEYNLKQNFKDIEIGTVKEMLMKQSLDFFIVVARNKD